MSEFEGTRMTVKLYAEEPVEVGAQELIPVFHRWIQDQALEHQLPIDVADYEHVHRGPGVILACHEGHYSFDRSDGRRGLRYRHKGSVEAIDPFCDALQAALTACLLLQNEESLGDRLRFGADQIRLQIDDRLRAPNSPRTLLRVRRYLRTVSRSLFGDTAEVDIEHTGAATDPFGVLIGVINGPDLETLLGRAAATAL